MANTYVKIGSTVEVGAGGAANIAFTAIPSTYTDLIVLYSLRSDSASAADNAEITFNGSTTTYSSRRLYGSGSGSGASDSSATYTTSSFIVGDGATTSTFGNGMIYIPNYAGSTNKSFSIDAVNETNATAAFMGLYAHLWATSSAITSIQLEPNGGSIFKQYSTASLYGILKS
jgi:hypothetical protein